MISVSCARWNVRNRSHASGSSSPAAGTANGLPRSSAGIPAGRTDA